MNKLRGDKKKYTFTDKTKQDVTYLKTEADPHFVGLSSMKLGEITI